MNQLEAYIFDQDGTLYSKQTNLGAELSKRTKQWMLENTETVISSFDDFKRQFPNFPEALAECRLTLSQWHENVCDPISYEVDRLIERDAGLTDFLTSLRGPKYLVTLSSLRLSEKLLSVLGLRDQFTEIFNLDTKDKGPTYQKIQRYLGILPHKIGVFGDNEEIDLRSARQQGLQSFFVDSSRPIAEQFNTDSLCRSS